MFATARRYIDDRTEPVSYTHLDVYKRQGDHLTLRKHIMPQKDMYPGCALAYLSVPLRLVRNGQVFQTELGGVPLFDLERPDLCLNVSELLEMIQ